MGKCTGETLFSPYPCLFYHATRQPRPHDKLPTGWRMNLATLYRHCQTLSGEQDPQNFVVLAAMLITVPPSPRLHSGPSLIWKATKAKQPAFPRSIRPLKQQGNGIASRRESFQNSMRLGNRLPCSEGVSVHQQFMTGGVAQQNSPLWPVLYKDRATQAWLIHLLTAVSLLVLS